MHTRLYKHYFTASNNVCKMPAQFGDVTSDHKAMLREKPSTWLTSLVRAETRRLRTQLDGLQAIAAARQISPARSAVRPARFHPDHHPAAVDIADLQAEPVSEARSPAA